MRALKFVEQSRGFGVIRKVTQFLLEGFDRGRKFVSSLKIKRAQEIHIARNVAAGLDLIARREDTDIRAALQHAARFGQAGGCFQIGNAWPKQV